MRGAAESPEIVTGIVFCGVENRTSFKRNAFVAILRAAANLNSGFGEIRKPTSGRGKSDKGAEFERGRGH